MAIAYLDVPKRDSDRAEDTKTVRFERQGVIGRIVLANPPRNLIDRQFSECLRQAVHDASESDIRVLVVQTEGPHFSFGSDLREWIDKDVNWFRTFIAEVNLSYRAIEALKVPTIAAIQGVTLLKSTSKRHVFEQIDRQTGDIFFGDAHDYDVAGVCGLFHVDRFRTRFSSKFGEGLRPSRIRYEDLMSRCGETTC